MQLAITPTTRPSAELDDLRFRAQLPDAICQLRCSDDIDEFAIFANATKERQPIIDEVLADFGISRDGPEFADWRQRYAELYPNRTAQATA